MQPGTLFRNPADLLAHDHFQLKDLFAEYERFVPGEREKKAELIRRLGDHLRLHFRIEEQLLYPPLLAGKSRAVQELVKAARNEHKAIIDAFKELGQAGEEEQGRGMKALFKQVELNGDFEDKRVLPWTRTLPEVTLREMTLEIQGMLKGERGRGS